MVVRIYRTHLEHATSVSCAEGVVDFCLEHPPLVLISDVELDAPPFLNRLLRDDCCLDANPQHGVCSIRIPDRWP